MKSINVVLLAPFLFYSCSEECEKIKGPWETVVQMVSDPEEFQDYVESHEDEFDSQFKKCVKNKLDAIQKKISDEYDQCTLKYSYDLAVYEVCTGGVEDKYGTTESYLIVMDAVINGEVTFDATALSQELVYLKVSEPAMYEEIVQLYQTSDPNPWLVCEKCDTKILGIF